MEFPADQSFDDRVTPKPGLLQDPDRGRVVRLASGNDAAHPWLLERPGGECPDSFGREAAPPVSRNDAVPDLDGAVRVRTAQEAGIADERRVGAMHEQGGPDRGVRVGFQFPELPRQHLGIVWAWSLGRHAGSQALGQRRPIVKGSLHQPQ